MVLTCHALHIVVIFFYNKHIKKTQQKKCFNHDVNFIICKVMKFAVHEYGY